MLNSCHKVVHLNKVKINPIFLIVVLALLSPIVVSLDTESGFLSPSKRVLELRELGMLANYPGYQAILPPFKRNGGGGLNFKRNGGVPDECRGKYDTSIYTQVVTSSSKDVTIRASYKTEIVKQKSIVKRSFDSLYPFQKLCPTDMEFVTNGTSDMCVFGLGLNFEEFTQNCFGIRY